MVLCCGHTWEGHGHADTHTNGQLITEGSFAQKKVDRYISPVRSPTPPRTASGVADGIYFMIPVKILYDPCDYTS